MHRDNMEKLENQRRINELFNLADSSFMHSDDRMHTYKLGQPTPKVTMIMINLRFVNCHALLRTAYCLYLADRRH